MENDSAVAVAQESGVTAVPVPVPVNMTLIARRPDELRAEQVRLITWCDRKIDESVAEQKEIEESIALYKSNKWGVGPLKTALRRAQQRDLFYTKVKCALDAGFYIVPNFPADVFAIRTDRPAGGGSRSTYSGSQAINNLPTQKAEVLGIGEGDYKNPAPAGKIAFRTEQKKSYPLGTSEKETVFHAIATDYSEMEFPFAFAKPEVLTATQEAMAMKLFDELAVIPGTQHTRRRVDPMIVGRIIRPWQRNSGDAQRHITFLVVWWLDTATI